VKKVAVVMAESGIPRSAHMHGPHPVPDIELRIDARAENVAIVRHRLTPYLRGLRLGEEQMSDVLLAVTEACTNVVVHAYEGAGGSIDVTAWRSGPDLRIIVRDRGGGMRPRVDSPGLGLGLPVMMALASAVAIRPREGGGTEVSLAFRLDDAPASA
jgi:anti-sigma regulatory factor (Ser/Thr protein kinase)